MMRPTKETVLQHRRIWLIERRKSHNENVAVLGDFNAVLHVRETGEEECLGPRVWGKGIRFLRNREGVLPEIMNRSLPIDLLKAYDMRCMNAFFPKPDNKKATYRHVGNGYARPVEHGEIQ